MATERERLENRGFKNLEFSSWFWRTSWSEVFSTAAYREVREEQDAVQKLVDFKIDEQWSREHGLPERFDFRSARVRLFTLRVSMMDSLCDETGQRVSGIKILRQHGRSALVRLFPIPRSAPKELKSLMQGPGNRFFIRPEADKIFRDRLINGPDFTSDALASHFMEAADVNALRSGHLMQFFQRRRSAMERWDEQQWASCKASSIV